MNRFTAYAMVDSWSLIGIRTEREVRSCFWICLQVQEIVGSSGGQTVIVGSIANRLAERIELTLRNSPSNSSTMNEYVTQYYRCPERYIRFDLAGQLSQQNGYFRFGEEGLCYGQL